MKSDKQNVHDFWNRASCGEELYLQNLDQSGFDAQAQRRYELEPDIPKLADFGNARGKRILEIGV